MYAYRIMRPFITVLFKLYYNPIIEGKDNIPKKEAVIIAGNHKHALDPIFVDVCTKRSIHTLAKKELFVGRMGFFFKLIGSIPVKLSAKRNRVALKRAIGYLNDDVLVNLSPEAKRNFTDELLLPFKYGAAYMAKKTRKKIVPYSITGDYRFRSKNLKIEFGEPIDTEGLTVEEANERLYGDITALLKKNMSVEELKTKKEYPYRGIPTGKIGKGRSNGRYLQREEGASCSSGDIENKI